MLDNSRLFMQKTKTSATQDTAVIQSAMTKSGGSTVVVAVSRPGRGWIKTPGVTTNPRRREGRAMTMARQLVHRARLVRFFGEPTLRHKKDGSKNTTPQ